MTLKVALAHKDQLSKLKEQGGGANTFELAQAAMLDPENLIVALEILPAASFAGLEPENAIALGQALIQNAHAVLGMRQTKREQAALKSKPLIFGSKG